MSFDYQDLGGGQPSEQVVDVSELVVNHQGEHTHLGGTALVEFLGAVVELSLFRVSTDKAYRETRSTEISREGSLGPAKKKRTWCESQKTTKQ